MPETIGHELHLSPNPRAKPSTPGEYHNWVAEKDAEIERLQLALRIAVEEIQAGDHGKECSFGKLVNRYPPFESFTRPTCRSMSSCHACEHCIWLDANPPEVCRTCNCWKASALARIERAKDETE